MRAAQLQPNSCATAVLYHLANRYIVHLDLEAPAAKRAELAVFMHADPVYSHFQNVKVVTHANLVTYRGPTMVANMLHVAAILLREGGDWDLFSKDDLLYVLSGLPRELNFIEHTVDMIEGVS